MHPDRCLECGFEFREPRTRLVARTDRFPSAMEGMLATAGAGRRLRRRPSPTVWSPLEYAAHVGEALAWYAGRVRRVLDEDEPQLEPFDVDAAAEEGAYNNRDLDVVVADVRAACQDVAEIARTATGISLSRSGVGSDGSPRSAELLLVRASHEIVHHELDMRRGLGLAPEQ